MHIATLITVALALASGPAAAAPKLSQHPRVGQLTELRFAPASAELPLASPVVARQLGQVAAWAIANPDALVVLDGHADRRGTHEANIRLSLRRAHAVGDRLVALGVPGEQIVMAGYGADDARPDRRVIVWGTRAGLDAVVARTLRRGHVVRWAGVLTPSERPDVISGL